MSKQFQLAVIGGGFTGLGVALAAGKAGIRTILLEKDGCCRETSANSLGIVHGGFRYLQNFHIARLRQSALDQQWIAENFPEFVSELRCLIPCKAFGARSALGFRLASACYRLITPVPTSADAFATYSQDTLPQLNSVLRQSFPNGAFQWTDYRIDDLPGLVAALLRSIKELGVVIRERVEVSAVSNKNSRFYLDLNGDESAVEARTVVNAAGSSVHELKIAVNSDSGTEVDQRATRRWCRGFNVVTNLPLTTDFGIAVLSDSSRSYFIVPRPGGTAVGTQYLPMRENGSDSSNITEAEVIDFLEDVNRSFANPLITLNDITAIEAGVLPHGKNVSGKPVPLAKEQMIDNNGYIEVVSTKLTTFRSLGDKVLRLAKPYLR